MAVGAGGSEEAVFDLRGSEPAGTYHLILDCIIVYPVDTTFELIWRRAGSDTELITPFTEHYEPEGGGQYRPQNFEYDKAGTAIDFVAGDQFVFRYSANGSSMAAAYEPDGDGDGTDHDGGRIPSITFPN